MKEISKRLAIEFICECLDCYGGIPEDIMSMISSQDDIKN